MPQEAENDAVKRRACGLLPEVGHCPAAAAAVKLHAIAGLVAGVAAVPGPAPHVKPPAELKPHLRLAVAGQPTVARDLVVELRILRVNETQPSYAPAPHQLPRATTQHSEVVAVLEIMAPHDGAGGESVGQLLPGVHPYTPVGQGLVPLPGVGDVAVLVGALLRHGTLRLDDDRLGEERVHPFQRPLEQPGGDLLAQHRFHFRLLPRLVVRLDRGNYPPVDARIAQLARDEGPHHPVHIGNAPRPDVPPFDH